MSSAESITRFFQIAGNETECSPANLFSLIDDHLTVLEFDFQRQGDQLSAQWLLEGTSDQLDNLQDSLLEQESLTVLVSSANENLSGDRQIITLMANQLVAADINAILERCFACDLQLLRSHRLSAPSAKYQVVETIWQGQLSDNGEALHKDLLETAMAAGIDVAVQADDLYRTRRQLVCFDMDSTLIKTEVIDELAMAAGVGDQVIEITERAMQGELDFSESFKARVALLKGLDSKVLDEIADRLPIMDGAERLISNLKAMGMKTAIFSGGFTFFAKRLQQKLGIDYIYANELDIVDGKVTGEVTSPIVNAERKAELLQELALKEGIDLQQTVAVGDGANDLKMLAKAGLGVAFRAKPLVQQQARHAVTQMGLDGILYLLGVNDHQL